MGFNWGMLGGPVTGYFYDKGDRIKGQEEQAIEDAKARLEQAQSFLNPEAINTAFGGMQETMAPFMNQIAANQAMVGQSAARGFQGSLARAGLGSTGMGAAMGQGAMAGAQLGGQQLRDKMMMDLYQEAVNLQKSKAGITSSFQMPQTSGINGWDTLWNGTANIVKAGGDYMYGNQGG